MILFRVLLIAFTCVSLTQAAPRQKESPNTEDFWEWLKKRIESFPEEGVRSDESRTQLVKADLKRKIQSVLDEWKPADNREKTRAEIRQRMQSLAKQMEAGDSIFGIGVGDPNSSEITEFFDNLNTAASQKIQDLLDRVKERLGEETSLTSAPEDDSSTGVQDFLDELMKDVRLRIDKFVQEMQENLKDMADSLSQISREDVEEFIKEITEQAETQINELMNEIRGLFNNTNDSQSVSERIRLFINQRTSKNNDKLTREALVKRFQSFVTQMRSRRSTFDFDFDFPNATALRDYFNKTRNEMRQRLDGYMDNLRGSFDDLPRFNFSDIDFDMEDFFNETRGRFDDFLKQVQKALDNGPNSFNLPSREEIRNFFNETLQDTYERIRGTINEIRDFLETIFGDKTDNENTTTQPDEEDDNKTTTQPDEEDDNNTTTQPDEEDDNNTTTRPDEEGDNNTTTQPDEEGDNNTTTQPDEQGDNNATATTANITNLLNEEDFGVFMAGADDGLSLAIGHGSEDGSESSSSVGTTTIVVICVGAAFGSVVAGVLVRRRMMGRKKMYKHVSSPSAAKLQAASLRAMAHSSYEYGTCEEAYLKSANYHR